ncbi:unnamed protein product [Orchesella dallaii]|uniref:histone acetyltransferase n=1 Tax=Orchesella dallaii TaxID=48710 RepID=A0ABP1RFY9_9HEXA
MTSVSDEHERALKKPRLQCDTDENSSTGSLFEPFASDSRNSELEDMEYWRRGLQPSTIEDPNDSGRVELDPSNNDSGLEQSPPPEDHYGTSESGDHGDSGSVELDPSNHDSGLEQSPPPADHYGTSESGDKGQNNEIDYTDSRSSNDKINENDGCKRCTGSESCLIAPFVECHFCHRSIGEGETYWLYQGWVICDVSCFADGEDPVTLETGSEDANVGSKSMYVYVSKSEFESAVNFANEPAPIIQCEYCRTRFHRICINYPKTDLSPAFLDSEFACEECEEKRKFPRGVSLPKVISAKSIRETYLSKYMEKRVNHLVPEMPKVLVRVVANVPKKYKIDNRVLDYMNKQSVEFSYMEKTICCFQSNTLGNYHMIFVLYVQEYDTDCPLPNRNCIYIAVLDSVRLFVPLDKRTSIFQAVMITYLDFMRKRGFENAFLWCCPPRGPGLDYVFYRKPNDQQVITAPLLINWYKCLFKIAKNVKVLAKSSTLMEWVLTKGRGMKEFKEKFPFFPDDYWPDAIAKLIDEWNAKNHPPGWLFKEIKSQLRTNQNSFYALTLNTSPKNTFPMSDVVIPSLLAVNREMVVKFFRNNNLEFQDIRKATFSTLTFLLEVAFESMSVICNQCTKGITKGYACLDCECYRCMECCGCKHAASRKRDIRIAITIPNLFKKEYKWKEFKAKLLKYFFPTDIQNPIPVNIFTSNFTVLVKHCSRCGMENCWKCKIVFITVTRNVKLPISDYTFQHIKQEDLDVLGDAFSGE